MRINKLYFGFLLIAVLLISDEVSSDDTALNVANAALPAITGILAAALATSPAGPFVAVGLGIIHVAAMIFMTDGDDPNEISKADLKTLKEGIDIRFKDLSDRIAHSTSSIISELTYTVESQPILSGIRTTLDEFRRDYDYYLGFILDQQDSEITREAMSEMLSFGSSFRRKLRSFITDYIKTSVTVSSSPVKLFFDLLLEKNRLLAADNSDWGNDSLQSRMYKAYLVITKILTDSYAMAASAFTIKYQKEISLGHATNARDVKKAARKLIEEYQYAMGNLSSKAKTSLDLASTEIRNSCKFLLKEGENFARLPFVTTITQHGRCSSYSIPIKKDGYQLLYCKTAQELSLPIEPSNFYDTYYNSTDTERPLVHMKNGDSIFIGHNVPESSHLTKGAYNPSDCFPDFCAVYKREIAGVCTTTAKAKPGNVITGARFNVREGILYVDIQEGTLNNNVEVAPETVHWTKTVCGSKYDLTYFDRFLSAFEIDDIVLGDGDYITSVGFYKASTMEHQNGIMWLEVGKNGKFSSPYRPRSLANNEIKLTEADDPQKASPTRFISIPPHPTEASFIQLQTSSVKKDFGRTTVPYFDTREVVSYPPSPLSGIGIYHEAGEEDGGLLALKLFSPKLSKYIDYNKILTVAKP